jgi:nitroimidazol reductase NimA-like FMN-containing flavoprotein (pyridoxamine 5'-phosphate oxidase superfamily)
MPGYGVPSGPQGMLNWRWAELRLKNSHNYFLATVRPDGRPHLMPIWGVWVDNALLFSTGRRSRKAKNLSEHPRCIVATDHASQVVIVEGLARETPDVALRRRMIQLTEKKYKFDLSSYKKDILNLKEPIYVVRPITVFGLDEKKFPRAATRWMFPS